jgi:hypothetical protein
MSNRVSGRSEWDWYAWRLPLGDATLQQDAQMRMTVLCTREGLPKMLTESQGQQDCTAVCASRCIGAIYNGKVLDTGRPWHQGRP